VLRRPIETTVLTVQVKPWYGKFRLPDLSRLSRTGSTMSSELPTVRRI
jgi:hypothetical protein